MHIADIVSEEVLAVVSVVDCSRVCFVLNIDVEVLSVYGNEIGLVLFDRSQALDLGDRQFLLLLEWVGLSLTFRLYLVRKDLAKRCSDEQHC